jgi:3-oxoacyl-[acyl-carrier protein] reductase
LAKTLEGKVALVTGSGRNIGRAILLAMAAEGASVVVHSRENREEAESVAQEARDLGVQAHVALADMGVKEQVEGMVEQAVATFGRLDILVLNAAIRPRKPFMELTAEDWREVMSMVLDGAFYATKAALPSMVANKFGRIIYFGGDGSLTGGPFGAHISSAKMGLIGLTRSAAKAVGRDNITVNMVSPGRIDTAREPEPFLDRSDTGKLEIPVGRHGRPEEIAGACLYLASDSAAYMTGQVLHLGGGEHTWL